MINNKYSSVKSYSKNMSMIEQLSVMISIVIISFVLTNGNYILMSGL